MDEAVFRNFDVCFEVLYLMAITIRTFAILNFMHSGVPKETPQKTLKTHRL